MSTQSQNIDHELEYIINLQEAILSELRRNYNNCWDDHLRKNKNKFILAIARKLNQSLISWKARVEFEALVHHGMIELEGMNLIKRVASKQKPGPRPVSETGTPGDIVQ